MQALKIIAAVVLAIPGLILGVYLADRVIDCLDGFSDTWLGLILAPLLTVVVFIALSLPVLLGMIGPIVIDLAFGLF